MNEDDIKSTRRIFDCDYQGVSLAVEGVRSLIRCAARVTDAGGGPGSLLLIDRTSGLVVDILDYPNPYIIQSMLEIGSGFPGEEAVPMSVESEGRMIEYSMAGCGICLLDAACVVRSRSLESEGRRGTSGGRAR